MIFLQENPKYVDPEIDLALSKMLLLRIKNFPPHLSLIAADDILFLVRLWVMNLAYETK
tara:strand:+ start:581 stop:757 length:177 start_codon:yes stop_codon:yes gene_type:complete